MFRVLKILLAIACGVSAVAAIFPAEAKMLVSSHLPGFVFASELDFAADWLASPFGRRFGVGGGILIALVGLILVTPATVPDDLKQQNAVSGLGQAGKSDPEPWISPGTELRTALAGCRTAFISVFVFGALSNILMLTGAIYMLEVYDRVLPSRNIATLLALSILAAMLFTIQGVLDAIRSRLLVRVGAVLDASVNSRVLQAMVRLPQKPDQRNDGLQPMRDLDAVRGFLGGPGPSALMDMPWLPFYLAIIYVFHPLLGVAATVGTIVLVGLTLLTEIRSRKEVRGAIQESQRRSVVAESARRNAEAVLGMGMSRRLAERYAHASDALITRQNRVSDISGGLGSMARMLRIMLQSTMLGLGAWLVIEGQVSAGIIIAGSILVGRALAPVDQAIAQWKSFVAAREGWKRLKETLTRIPPEPNRLPLPAPRQKLSLEAVNVAEPGGQRVLVRDVSLELAAGSGLAVIGPSGSGKSTLARAMVGAWSVAAGRVRLDGAALDQWPSELAGRHLGYLPQDVELFAGTVAENISRLEVTPDPNAVVAAAMAAGCHDMILNLRDGYQTQIGEAGAVLSAGQRQRIALARALYGDPFLVVLDEPNAHLDNDGDKALQVAIHGVRERGGIAVVISHRPNALDAVDHVLLMTDGRPVAFGPRDPVLAKFFPTLVRERPQRLAGGARKKANVAEVGPEDADNTEMEKSA